MTADTKGTKKSEPSVAEEAKAAPKNRARTTIIVIVVSVLVFMCCCLPVAAGAVVGFKPGMEAISQLFAAEAPIDADIENEKPVVQDPVDQEDPAVDPIIEISDNPMLSRAYGKFLDCYNSATSALIQDLCVEDLVGHPVVRVENEPAAWTGRFDPETQTVTVYPNFTANAGVDDGTVLYSVFLPERAIQPDTVAVTYRHMPEYVALGGTQDAAVCQALEDYLAYADAEDFGVVYVRELMPECPDSTYEIVEPLFDYGAWRDMTPAEETAHMMDVAGIVLVRVGTDEAQWVYGENENVITFTCPAPEDAATYTCEYTTTEDVKPVVVVGTGQSITAVDVIITANAK